MNYRWLRREFEKLHDCFVSQDVFFVATLSMMDWEKFEMVDLTHENINAFTTPGTQLFADSDKEIMVQVFLENKINSCTEKVFLHIPHNIPLSAPIIKYNGESIIYPDHEWFAEETLFSLLVQIYQKIFKNGERSSSDIGDTCTHS